MVTLLLKKSYLHKDLKEVRFNDLWNGHGIFTTMRVVGKSAKIIFYKAHIDNLIISLKKYNIYKKNLKKNILNLIKINLKKNKKYDHLLRVASNNKIISISLRKRPIPKSNFKLKLLNYKRVDAAYKNLKYKKILKILSKLDVTKFDIALYKGNKILETGTSNLLFVKSNKIFSPKKDCYIGTTIKFFSKKVKINFKNIFIKDIKSFDEILVVGSGKGIASISSIENNSWKRKSLKVFNKLLKIYKSETKKN
ncbi:MAG: aminotransferase [Candidatus Pelagibacter sp. TMED239]|nr:MAG: aminotransferase [Candidatus Pelagibacter sp. TMED239]|tara:strand:- start:2116 stop:2871 length:756 start_codon:yes stop_codon:yes gene_type:complete